MYLYMYLCVSVVVFLKLDVTTYYYNCQMYLQGPVWNSAQEDEPSPKVEDGIVCVDLFEGPIPLIALPKQTLLNLRLVFGTQGVPVDMLRDRMMVLIAITCHGLSLASPPHADVDGELDGTLVGPWFCSCGRCSIHFRQSSGEESTVLAQEMLICLTSQPRLFVVMWIAATRAQYQQDRSQNTGLGSCCRVWLIPTTVAA